MGIVVEAAGIHWSTSAFLKKQTKLSVRGNARWVSEDRDRYYTWDSLHGEIEVFNKKGHHIGVYDKDGNPSNKGAVAGRTIDD
jgi:hypothetical protein